MNADACTRAGKVFRLGVAALIGSCTVMNCDFSATSSQTARKGPTDFPDLAERLGARKGKKGATWQDLADLMTFGFWEELREPLLPIAERLYIFNRYERMTGVNGVVADMGYTAAESAVLFRFQELQAAAAGDLTMSSRLTEARKIVGERLKIAEFNQVNGNTPDASITQGLKAMAGVYEKVDALAKSVDADAEAERSMSAETFRRFVDLKRSVGPEGLKRLLVDDSQDNEFPAPVILTAMLLGYDAYECDNQVSFWRRHLLPDAKRAAGPISKSAIISTRMEWWVDPRVFEPYPLLKAVSLMNIGSTTLTNVVVELFAENEFGEKKPQYFFFREWPVKSVRTVRLHLRLAMQTYSPSLTTHGTLWSDQLTSDIAVTTQHTKNPVPPYRQRYELFRGDQARLEGGAFAWGPEIVLSQDLPAPAAP